MGDEALSCFLCNWPSRSRSPSIGGFPARLQKLLKGLGHKVLSLWFAHQPFDGRAGMKLDLGQPLEIGFVSKAFSATPGLAFLAGTAAGGITR
jgi:hypothetical protein